MTVYCHVMMVARFNGSGLDIIKAVPSPNSGPAATTEMGCLVQIPQLLETIAAAGWSKEFL
jgi:hypothetical protein